MGAHSNWQNRRRLATVSITLESRVYAAITVAVSPCDDDAPKAALYKSLTRLEPNDGTAVASNGDGWRNGCAVQNTR